MNSLQVCSVSAYATVGSRLNLSALSISLKEHYKIDNAFDNTRVRKKHDSIEALTSSKTFFNSLSFYMKFSSNKKSHYLHIRVFTTGTIHITGASDYEETTKRAFVMTYGLIAACHHIEKDICIVQDISAFGLRQLRVAMLQCLYHHTRVIDREATALNLQHDGRNVRYDPRLHNSINVRFTGNNGAFLIFKSGKILVTGCKRVDTCMMELEKLLPHLC